VGSDPILFLGGVTLSRLWPVHAATKRIVAREFPANRLVSLTSTMFFVDDDDAADAADMFGDHQDTTLLAREDESAAQAGRVFGDAVRVIIEHDSSMRLGPLDVSTEPQHDILWLHRNDLEGMGRNHPTDVQVFDWPAVWDPMYRTPYIRLRANGAISRVRSAAVERTPRFVNRLMSRHYRIASRQMVECGARHLATGQVLVTDRMHPHILSAMIGQPVVLLPDRYGKNRSIFEHTTGDLSTVHWADTPDEGYELARSLITTSVS
jgi:pyruvyl transferase EpsO